MNAYDVVVIGAGSSGLCAAIAAAREGADVLLVEKTGIVGGTNTLSMVSPLMGFTAGGRNVIGGIAQEVIDRLADLGGTLGHIPDPLGVTDTITPIETELLKQVWFQMLCETDHLDLLLNAWMVSAEMKDNRIDSVMVQGKSGAMQVHGSLYIDATGDGDLAVMAGVPFVEGRKTDGLSQPMTSVFKVGNVDFDKVRAYMWEHPDQFVLAEAPGTLAYVAVSGFFDLVAEARKTGELTFARDRVLLFQGVQPDEALVNMSRVCERSGIRTMEITAAEMEGRRQMDEILTFFRKRIPGFEHCRLVASGDAIGIRESRHLEGQYCLTEQDVLSCAVFSDSVALCAFPIDIHDPKGKELHWVRTDTAQCYEVPYRVMLPRTVQNLIFTGRCVSATHEAAASVRITPTAMALGQAAGCAAGMAIQMDVSPAKVPVPILQSRLVKTGAIPAKAYIRGCTE